jgi:hypothetical protein
MSDIVERLREVVAFGYYNDYDTHMLEAADEIERLRAALSQIEVELLPAEQSDWLSASGKRIMAIIREHGAAIERRMAHDALVCGPGASAGKSE